MKKQYTLGLVFAVVVLAIIFYLTAQVTSLQSQLHDKTMQEIQDTVDLGHAKSDLASCKATESYLNTSNNIDSNPYNQ